MPAKKIEKKCTRFVMACCDRSEGKNGAFILRAPWGIYASESDARYAWAHEKRFSREKDNHIIGDTDGSMLRALFWGEIQSLWKLLRGKSPMPRGLDTLVDALRDAIREGKPVEVDREAPVALKERPAGATSGGGAVLPYRVRSPRRSGGGGKGGSALVKTLAEEKGVIPGKLRALLRKAGLSAPYTNEEECRKALGLK